ncbi:peroxisomal multifunctional beta-oxidation protein, partial [Penicillium tannophilum]
CSLLEETPNMNLNFEGQVAVVTGAGSGLGKAYALFLASRGASVVVNDVGTSLTGQGNSLEAADEVVKEITGLGGKAVASYDSVEHGENIIDTALRAFGRVDILINNAGVLRDVAFKNMTDAQWDAVIAVHLRGAYKTTHAAWSHFRKQKYGRVILTSSAAGLFGSFGQCNYSAAKAGMVGLGETLAKEGAKYNILTNIISPIAASRMTATVMPTELLEHLKPEWVVPLVSFLVHPRNQYENGSIFEVGGGHVSKLRWERSQGGLLKCDETMTPGAVLANWAAINDFHNAEYPTTTVDLVAKLRMAQQLPPNKPGVDVDFNGRVAVVTGGGAGLGRAYCIQLAKLGASVVVNDLMNPGPVVEEIRAFGGTAVPNKSSAEDGDAVIKTAIENFGRIDILINNAGILRDKAFQNMTEKIWDEVGNVHLRATYKCSKAAYPYMVKQKYGRIVNTTSTSGIYGNYGQTNYAAAKTAIIGFSRALALEGRKYNIQVNCISPSAGTNLTKAILSEEVVKSRKPEFVAPIVVLLCSDKAPATASGQVFEAGCGWQARTRFQRSDGVDFPLNERLTPEKILDRWQDITSFTTGKTSNPEVASDLRKRILKNAILYNISLGATSSQLPLVYEKDPHFQLLPSFGVIPGTMASRSFNLETLVPNYSHKMLLHGEHFLEIRKYPIATSGTLASFSKLQDILDKGKQSVAIVSTLTIDAKTREELFYNEFSLVIRGAGGFGGPAARSSRNEASATYHAPDRKPDAVLEEKTSVDQAALYRLNGDRNPLHVDPAVSQAGGFEAPILHGLCTFGISTKHIVSHFGQIKNIKVRFVSTVIPGQTLLTEMWKDGNVVIFQTRIKETGKLCISGGGARIDSPPGARL